MDDDIKRGKLITDLSIDVLAKSIIKEAAALGFEREDYIKLVNLLLDSALWNDLPKPTKNDTLDKYKLNKKIKLPYESEKLILRNIQNDDLPLINKWLKDELGKLFLLTGTSLRRYKFEEMIDSGKDLVAVITLPEGRPIGVMAFLDIDKEQRKAEMRKLVGNQDYRGKGLGKLASQMWIQYGISSLGLRKIYINTLEANIRNIRINNALGFSVEGVLSGECLIDGEYRDILRMGLVVE